MIAILGSSVPEITEREIRHVFDLRAIGQDRELMVFRYRPPRARIATSRSGRPSPDDLIVAVRNDYSTDIIYRSFTSAMGFQSAVMIHLFKFIATSLTPAFGPLGGGR